MVIMAQARKNRKQWRPKAAIESAAAQHRTNVNSLVTSFLQDRRDSGQLPVHNDSIEHKILEQTNNKIPLLPHEPQPASNNVRANNLALNVAMPVLAPSLRASINVTSSSGDPLDDDERDDIALFVHNEQKRHSKKADRDNQIEVLAASAPARAHARTSVPKLSSKPTHAADRSEVESPHQAPSMTNSAQKAHLKTETNAHGLPITSSATQANNTKNAKRKAYSRMKKERKATQTLIIVLSTSSSPAAFRRCSQPISASHASRDSAFSCTRQTFDYSSACDCRPR